MNRFGYLTRGQLVRRVMQHGPASMHQQSAQISIASLAEGLSIQFIQRVVEQVLKKQRHSAITQLSARQVMAKYFPHIPALGNASLLRINSRRNRIAESFPDFLYRIIEYRRFRGFGFLLQLVAKARLQNGRADWLPQAITSHACARRGYLEGNDKAAAEELGISSLKKCCLQNFSFWLLVEMTRFKTFA